MGRPSRIEVASSATSVVVKPRRAARPGSTWKVVAGPLMVLSMPFCASTTPGILLMASSTLGPSWLSRAVAGEELDLDGLGRVGEVADHVLQDLGELDVEVGLGLPDPLAGILHDLVDVAVAVGLEADGEVAGVGFGDGGEAHLQAGAAAGGGDLGGAAQDLLDVLQDAVGLGQRGAGGHEVVEDEGAFVHLGQQIGA